MHESSLIKSYSCVVVEFAEILISSFELNIFSLFLNRNLQKFEDEDEAQTEEEAQTEGEAQIERGVRRSRNARSRSRPIGGGRRRGVDIWMRYRVATGRGAIQRSTFVTLWTESKRAIHGRKGRRFAPCNDSEWHRDMEFVSAY